MLIQPAHTAACWSVRKQPSMQRNLTCCRSMAPPAVAASWDAAVHTHHTEQQAVSPCMEDHAALLGEQRVAMQQQASTSYVQVLSTINESTKWAVSFLVCGVLVWRHDRYAAWSVLGAIVSSFICKVLKHVINQERPNTARKLDPGMPSSHANSLIFLSTYAAIALISSSPRSLVAWGLSLPVLAAGVFLTWLRVALGFHTFPQVLVGGVLGASTAGGWFAMGTTGGVVASLQAWGPGLPLLYTMTGLAMAIFAVRNVFSWFQERKQHKAAGQPAPMQQPHLALG